MNTQVPRPLKKEANMVFFGCNTEDFTGEGKALLQVSLPILLFYSYLSYSKI